MINVPYMLFSNLYATSSQFTSQMNSGCQLVLSYVDTTHIKVAYGGMGSSINVIFPNLHKYTVTTSGVTLTFSGSASTFYYVYLTTAGSIVLSTTAPDTTYTNQQTLGADKILIGYAGLSATNTMAGNWNVFSYYGQAALTWTTTITTCGNAYAAVSLPGFVIPSGKIAFTTANSSVVIALHYTWVAPYIWDWSGTIAGIGSWTPGCALALVTSYQYGAIPQVTFSTLPTHTNITNGIFNLTNVGMLMPSLNSVGIYGYDCYPSSCVTRKSQFDGSATPTCSSASGTVTFTRPGNV